MDVLMLSRIQFGVNAGFHYIFPPLTFGLTLIILFYESLYVRTESEFYRAISSFLIKILGLVFAVGVATGIVLEFSFGTNWANYSRMVGDIFGAPLAAEGIFAFFLESVFIAVLLFGREKVSKKFYWFAALTVFFASHLSGFWIIIANSWMQTPAGYAIEGGRAVLTDPMAAFINDSTLIRFTHTVLAAWLTGSLFVAGISAWYLLKERAVEYARSMMKVSLMLFIALAFLQFASGHGHSVQVAKTQPEKMAAFEALWIGTEGAALSLFGIPDTEKRVTHFEIAVPKLLSFLVHLDPDAKIAGLNEFPEDELPPVALTYFSYHIMIAIGGAFAGIAMLALFYLVRKPEKPSWFYYILMLSIPLPHIANLTGWMAAEIGRQPWTVYRVLKTADSFSPALSAGQVMFSLIMFSLIYILLFWMFMKLLIKIIKKGPGEVTSGTGY
jgi:cytochrome d ubiquinol oxidase subunit I